jgi:hypothetical protein
MMPQAAPELPADIVSGRVPRDADDEAGRVVLIAPEREDDFGVVRDFPLTEHRQDLAARCPF